MTSEINDDMEATTFKNKPKNYLVKSSIQPDVWLKPLRVFEISADCFSLSPTYPLGKELKLTNKDDHKEHGLSLRFPVFKRVREDKATRKIEDSENKEWVD